MTSRPRHLVESTDEARHTDSNDNTSKPNSDPSQDKPSDVSLQEAHGDEQALYRFVEEHILPAADLPRKTHNRLPCPVVIPQRRPGNKERGFVEAYAPMLEQFSIKQDEFINFVKATNKAVRASKWLGAIQLAAFGTSFIPNSIAMGASVAAQVVAGMIAKAQTRWKTNSFLDRANEEYFGPRGLYCLLIAYHPSVLGGREQQNVGDTISKFHLSSSMSSSAGKQNLPALARKNLRNPVVGVVEEEENLPSNVAPLVYSVAPTSEEAFGSKKKRNTMARITNYLDDRAQARYANESKGDILSNPSPPTFKNRYLDPNHPATNGGLLGMVSGGYLTPNADKVKERMQTALHAQTQAVQTQQLAAEAGLRQQLTWMNISTEQDQAFMKQYNDMFELQEQQMRQQEDLLNNQMRQMRKIKHVLYLMIVEIPPDEQITAARRHLDASNGVRLGPEVAMRTIEV